MSNSKLATLKVPAYSGNYTKGRSKKIAKITIHHMAAVLSAKECGKIFQKKGRNGSSHYGIGKDGEIALYVDEANTAWTDSNWDSNCKSVTIENSNSKSGGDWPVGEKTLNSLIKLCADIAKRNNLGKLKAGKNLTWHSMYAATTCPGNYLRSKMDYITERANLVNYPKTEGLKVGDKVKITAKGNARYDGKGPVANGVGYTRTILKIYRGKAFPYQVGTKKMSGSVTTGYYKKTALKEVK